MKNDHFCEEWDIKLIYVVVVEMKITLLFVSSEIVMTLVIRGVFINSLWTAHSHGEHMNSIVKWLFFQNKTASFWREKTSLINDASLFSSSSSFFTLQHGGYGTNKHSAAV